MTARQLSIVGGLMIAVGPLSVTMYTPAMPQIVADLETTEAALQATISIFFAGFAISQLICGTLSDGLGRKAVALACFGLYVIASLTAFLAPTFEVLLAARLAQGVGAAAGVTISRALVRDLFVGAQSSRLFNAMGAIVAVGPALAPALGGLILAVAGYRGIFAAMCLHGTVVLALIALIMRETVSFDLSRIRPRQVAAGMGTLLRSGDFMLPTVAVSGVVGAIYGQATILPFILISQLGLSPLQFGIGMALQSGAYMVGTLMTAQWLSRVDARRLVPFGLGITALGAALIPVLLLTTGPSFLGIMAPIGLMTFGFAHSAPSLTTAAYKDLPKIAGATSSLNGSIQMGAGLLFGMIATAIANPMMAIGVVTPAFALAACVSGGIWCLCNPPADRPTTCRA